MATIIPHDGQCKRCKILGTMLVTNMHKRQSPTRCTTYMQYGSLKGQSYLCRVLVLKNCYSLGPACIFQNLPKGISSRENTNELRMQC